MTSRPPGRPLSCPFVFAVGVNTRPGETASDIREFNDFYESVHLAEVLSNPGFVSAARYELSDPDPSGNIGPQWLAVYGIGDEISARRFVERASGPAEQRMMYTPGPPAWKRMELVWRMVWRSMGSMGESGPEPDRIAMIGMNPAGDASDVELAEFDEFYTGTHLPEIVSGFGYVRGTRLELWNEFHHPEPGCPRFCAVYEAEGASAESPPAPDAVPLSAGPRAWEGREVRWRRKYRRIA